MASENLEIKINAIDNFSKTFASVGTKMKVMGQAMTNLGSSLTRYVTLPIVGVGIAGIKAAADFEAGMSNVRSVTMASKKDMEMMEKAAIEMAGRYKGSAKDAADALYYIASAGYSAADSASALQGVMSLASATNSDLAYTSENVMTAISMFGLKASETTRVADVYSKACQMSQAEMSKLADSMRYAGPIAKTLGWSIEATTATLSRLYDAGFKGEQAGTILRGALSRLIDPSKEVKETLDKMGISLDQLAKAMKNPADLIDLFRGKSITAQQAVALFGQEAGPGMLTLLEKGGDAIRDYNKKLDEAAGTADKAAKIQMENLKGKLEKLKDAFDKFAITLSKNKGALDSMSKLLDKAANAANKLTPAQQELGVKIAITVAAMGPFLTILGNIIKAIGYLAKAISWFLGSPIAMAAALITAVVAGGIFFDKLPAWAQILLTIISPWSFVIDKAKDFIAKVKELGGLSNVWDNISSHWSTGTKNVGDSVSKLGDAIKEKFGLMVSAVRQFGSNLMNAFSQSIIGRIASVVGAFIQLNQTMTVFMFTWILEGIKWGTGLIGNFILGINQKISGLGAMMGTWLAQHINQPIASFTISVTSKGSALIANFIVGMWQKMTGLNAIVAGWMWAHIGAPIANAASAAYQWGVSIIANFINGLKSKISEAARYIRQLASQIASMTPGGQPTLGPAFQSGGIVPGPPSQPRQITAHGGETVLPEYVSSFFKRVGFPVMAPAMSGNVASTVHTHVYLDGREVAQSVNYHNAGISEGL